MPQWKRRTARAVLLGVAVGLLVTALVAWLPEPLGTMVLLSLLSFSAGYWVRELMLLRQEQRQVQTFLDDLRRPES